jgi:hypothetical protein
MNALQPPDPMAIANAQEKFNMQAAENQQALNMVNQVTPFGTLEYAPTSGSPIGSGGLGSAYPGMYSAYTKLSKPLQKLFNIDVGNATQSARIANALQNRISSNQSALK